MYQQYLEQKQKIKDVESAIGLMHWDMETYMPEGAAKVKSRQIGTLSSINHNMATSTDYENLLNKLKDENSLTDNQKKNVELSLSDFNRTNKLPAKLVAEMTKASSEGFMLWQKANKENDFGIFSDQLEKIVDLCKQSADLYGYEGHIYNGLLESYEPGATTEEIDVVFSDVKSELLPLLKDIQAKGEVDNSFLKEKFNVDSQWDFGIDLLKQMGYDFKHGRQDKAHHPFSISFGSEDVRVTTRVVENDVMNMVGSCIHEGGHGLYEQGFNSEAYGLPESEAISYGIHESMSRFWENNIGLSREYWQFNFPKMQKYFPAQLGSTDFDTFYKAINKVSPSLVRTVSDEITYHFHIMVRYEIEKGLLTGDIKVKDLPEFWNARYKEYLGVDVPSDQQGVLQDVHWSHGSIGYFPTYSLGSFYAAQWHHSIKKAFPDFNDRVQSGDLLFIKNWLQENVYQYGRLKSSKELCTDISGEPLNFKYFLDYAKSKYLG